MKSIFSFLVCITMITALSSCEKCATCTSVSDDPLTEGETLTDEVCGTGRDYTDQVEIYERADWTCSTGE